MDNPSWPIQDSFKGSGSEEDVILPLPSTGLTIKALLDFRSVENSLMCCLEAIRGGSIMANTSTPFSARHDPAKQYWYLTGLLSYRDIDELKQEHGFSIDKST